MRAAVVLVAVLLVWPIAVVPAVSAAPAAPGFKVRLLDGKRSVDSRDLIGKKVLVLRFQASYCAKCVREAPALSRLADRYRSRPVQVLAVHVQDPAPDVRRFLAAHRATYDVALDPTLTMGNRYGFKGTPYTVVVDRRGEIVFRQHGEGALARLPQVLDDALRRG